MLTKIIILVLFETFSIFPQNYTFENILPEKGVSLNLTYSMLVDHRGFIWFGTMFGLVKYDGQNFKVYRHDPFDSTSISFDDIISLFEDNSGKIWAGTWGGGLNEFDPVNEKFTRYIHNENPESIGSNIIWAITQDKFGNIWVGCKSGILEELNNRKNTFTRISLPDAQENLKREKHSKINQILPDNNYLWVCSNGKLFKYNIITGKIDYSINKKLNNGRISYVYRDDKNNFWIGANGLFKLNKEGEIISHYSHEENNPNSISDNMILSMTGDKDGNIWVGTSRGLNKFDANLNKFIRVNYISSDERSGKPITSIIIDRGGLVWTSTYTVGVNKIIQKENDFKNYAVYRKEGNVLMTDPISAITETNKGEIFLGSYGGGLLKLDKTKDKVNRISNNDTRLKYIKSILADGRKIWIGSNAGLFIFDPLTHQIKNINFKSNIRRNFNKVKISSLMMDAKRRLWIGTDGFGLYFLSEKKDSLFFVNTNTDSIKNEGNQNYYILSLTEDAERNIWIGTYAGLFKLIENDNILVLYRHQEKNPHSISNNYVFSLCEDKKQNLWIGTANGLNKYNKKENGFDVYYETHGLPSGVIDGITQDYSGSIWISTNNGISKFYPETKQFINYNIKDGLNSSLFTQGAYLLSSEGKIYFGSQKSLVVYDPSRINPSKFSPPVYITSITVGNRDTSENTVNYPSGKIELKHYQNYLKINYASLDFSSPGSILYKYKLDGFENSWISANNRNFVEYKNLPPGNYKFIVMGTNSSGIWNSKTAEIYITILPPFWETAWFIAVTIVFLSIITYLVYKVLMNKKLMHAVEIERIKNEERDKVRKKTAADFHDELGHRLTRISILAELIKRKIPESINSIEPLLNKISENSAQLYSGTKDFIWSIDPQNDSLYDLIIRLKDFGDDIFTNTDVH